MSPIKGLLLLLLLLFWLLVELATACGGFVRRFAWPAAAAASGLAPAALIWTQLVAVGGL